MAKFPQIEFGTVENRLAAFTKPQHYKKGSTTETELTGHDNPLPTADYGMTEGGLWIPKRVSDDGAQHTQLTGSNVVEPERTIAESVTIEPGAKWESTTFSVDDFYETNVVARFLSTRSSRLEINRRALNYGGGFSEVISDSGEDRPLGVSGRALLYAGYYRIVIINTDEFSIDLNVVLERRSKKYG